jgi:hypothetical protein
VRPFAEPRDEFKALVKVENGKSRVTVHRERLSAFASTRNARAVC